MPCGAPPRAGSRVQVSAGKLWRRKRVCVPSYLCVRRVTQRMPLPPTNFDVQLTTTAHRRMPISAFDSTSAGRGCCTHVVAANNPLQQVAARPDDELRSSGEPLGSNAVVNTKHARSHATRLARAAARARQRQIA